MKTVIPGIPQAAIDSIADENTRIALQAIADGLNVRNGNTANKDGRFLTAGDLTQLASNGSLSTIIRQAARQAATTVYQEGGADLSPGAISKALSDLHAQVFESALFRELRANIERIETEDLKKIFEWQGGAETRFQKTVKQLSEEDNALSERIEKMGVRVGKSETGIVEIDQQLANEMNAIQDILKMRYAQVDNSVSALQTEETTIANAVAAMTKSVETLQTNVGAQTAMLQEQKEAIADINGKPYVRYTLKTEVNGQVSGFGIEANEGNSKFIVNADTFAVVSPTGENKAALIMENNTIVVFDENATPRVLIGDLTWERK